MNNRIILFGLPPHTTHFLQPLDVVCFQPLKHYHAEAIDIAVRTGDTEFSKIEFLAAFEGFRAQAFKPSTILSSFRKTGIVPHDPQRVLGPLQEKLRVTREEENRAGRQDILVEDEAFEDEDEEPMTPIAVQELHEASSSIQQDLMKAGLSPSVRIRIEKYIKGATIRLDFGDQIEQDLLKIEAAEKARKARKGTTQRQVTGGGILSVKDARRRVKQRQFGDEKKEIARFKNQLKRDRKLFVAQFEKAAAKARARIRRLGLHTVYSIRK